MQGEGRELMLLLAAACTRRVMLMLLRVLLLHLRQWLSQLLLWLLLLLLLLSVRLQLVIAHMRRVHVGANLPSSEQRERSVSGLRAAKVRFAAR